MRIRGMMRMMRMVNTRMLMSSSPGAAVYAPGREGEGECYNMGTRSRGERGQNVLATYPRGAEAGPNLQKWRIFGPRFP
jgi:hypothetical protein